MAYDYTQYDTVTLFNQTLPRQQQPRGSNDRWMCFDRKGIFAVLDELQFLYFGDVIYCSQNGSAAFPTLQVPHIILLNYTWSVNRQFGIDDCTVQRTSENHLQR